ncbi:HlyD family efflux transporter periplasmic adaptor subunit [uncultured Maribacter sp.]|uniref:efflux RND transporter periplasmic adaptor subunit n=1 Tax=uncultured Maribacter sp. TaxID=431308 RepID=UPI00262A09BB|nr:HlyD family efflux transporter periplasmic adaptor subunit [uncultured Maribacter sp.]
MRKIILSVIGVLLIVGAFFLAQTLIANKKKPKPKVEKVVKTVFVEKIENKTIPIIIPANGNLMAKRRVDIYAEVQGVFKTGSKLFKAGTVYRNGETIINIDNAEYIASVKSAKSNLYNQITSIMPDVRLDYPDIYPKWQSYLAGFDIDKTTPKLPEMSSEKEKFFISGRGVLTSYYNVKNLEQRLSKYRIAAPFKGVVTEALVTEGTLVRSGQKLGEFINTDVYELEVSISKEYSDLLKINEKVTLSNLDKTQTYIGKVVRVNGRVDVASQTIKAFIEIKDSSLKEGMYLEANLNAKAEENAIEIDRSLLLEGDKIYVVKDSILDVIEVKPIYFSDKKVVLKQVPDEAVILAKPVVGSYAGMAVKVYKKKQAKSKE